MLHHLIIWDSFIGAEDARRVAEVQHALGIQAQNKRAKRTLESQHRLRQLATLWAVAASSPCVIVCLLFFATMSTIEDWTHQGATDPTQRTAHPKIDMASLKPTGRRLRFSFFWR